MKFAGKAEADLKTGERANEAADHADDHASRGSRPRRHVEGESNGRAAESAGTRAKEFDVFPTAPSSPGARGRN
jgi:hypothetical protein